MRRRIGLSPPQRLGVPPRSRLRRSLSSMPNLFEPDWDEMLEDGTFWVRDYAPGLTPEDPSLDVPGLRPAE